MSNQQLKWIPIEDELSLGLTADVVWVKIPLQNQIRTTLPPSLPYLLTLTNPLLNEVGLYLVNGKQILAKTALGDHVPVYKKEIPVADLYWLLPATPIVPTHLYVRLQSDSFMQSHISLKSVPKAIVEHGEHYYMLGLFYGALVIMLAYNLFLYFQVRDNAYIFYVGYVFFIGSLHYFMDGLPYVVFENFYDTWGDRYSVYCMDMANIFSLLFVTKFLGVHEKMLLRSIRTLIMVFVAAILIELLEQGNFSTFFSVSMTIVTTLTITYITFRSWLNGVTQARYLAFAWVVLLASIPVYILSLAGILPSNFLTANALRCGVVIELALISFSLAHRINLLRQDRLSLQRRLNQELGSLVKERTTELEIANKRLQELSETDPLTQLKNRGFFNSAIHDESLRALRNGSQLSVLLADLDYFKSINDTLGHTAGDYCLKLFAKIFQQQVSRVSDLACRYGGEEFVALLPETDAEGALNVAEKIRYCIENSQLVFENNSIDLTVSIGIFTSEAHSDWEGNDWVEQADKALYFAKTQRNSIAYIDTAGEAKFAEQRYY
ncbi:MAG: diguanylate cyclase [Pseudomonadales bacterium]|nr:diguanylate cyclase [Pseudomonadales bacterium]